MSSLKTYIVRETAIGTAINLAIGSAFFFGVFNGQSDIAAWGSKGLIVDSVPQGFMVGLMSTIPAMLITHKRVKGGLAFEELGEVKPILPRNVFVRGLVVAVISMLGLVALAAVLAKLSGVETLPFWPAFVLKSLATLVLPMVIIPAALKVALTNKMAAKPLAVEG